LKDGITSMKPPSHRAPPLTLPPFHHAPISSAEEYQLLRLRHIGPFSGHNVILDTLDTWRSHTNYDGVSRNRVIMERHSVHL